MHAVAVMLTSRTTTQHTFAADLDLVGAAVAADAGNAVEVVLVQAEDAEQGYGAVFLEGLDSGHGNRQFC